MEVIGPEGQVKSRWSQTGLTHMTSSSTMKAWRYEGPHKQREKEKMKSPGKIHIQNIWNQAPTAGRKTVVSGQLTVQHRLDAHVLLETGSRFQAVYSFVFT